MAANAEPGRIIVNIESTDVKGDFERLKAAGATVVAEPYSFEQATGHVDRHVLRPRRELLPARQPDGPGAGRELGARPRAEPAGGRPEEPLESTRQVRLVDIADLGRDIG